jgi:Type VI secretion system/phage-baseplate injector OB domain
MSALYFGKYRGTVEGNKDPQELGRLQVSVPSVLGDTKLPWAMPCVPYAGKNVGFFALPPKGANVWVEFEAGNIDYPIWVGCFWNAGEVPAKPAVAETKMFKTDAIELRLSDARNAGGVKLDIKSPAVSTPITITADAKGFKLAIRSAELSVAPDGINIVLDPSAAQIKLSRGGIQIKNGGAAVKLDQIKVSLNNGALEVT